MNATTLTQSLKIARQTIEREQEESLAVDQACTIYDLCQALKIEPGEVLSPTSLKLIDPGDRQPALS